MDSLQNFCKLNVTVQATLSHYQYHKISALQRTNYSRLKNCYPAFQHWKSVLPIFVLHKKVHYAGLYNFFIHCQSHLCWYSLHTCYYCTITHYLQAVPFTPSNTDKHSLFFFLSFSFSSLFAVIDNRLEWHISSGGQINRFFSWLYA